jgi:hypothetical protein
MSKVKVKAERKARISPEHEDFMFRLYEAYQISGPEGIIDQLHEEYPDLDKTYQQHLRTHTTSIEVPNCHPTPTSRKD